MADADTPVPPASAPREPTVSDIGDPCRYCGRLADDHSPTEGMRCAAQLATASGTTATVEDYQRFLAETRQRRSDHG